MFLLQEETKSQYSFLLTFYQKQKENAKQQMLNIVKFLGLGRCNIVIYQACVMKLQVPVQKETILIQSLPQTAQQLTPVFFILFYTTLFYYSFVGFH